MAFFKEGTSNKPRAEENYVPIDIKAVAEALDEEPNLIFGRLYYHLQPKYGFEHEPDGRRLRVPFFEPFMPNGERHCINYPLLSSVIGGLRQEHSQATTALWLSIAAIIVSVVSLFS
jgi:hypothetical protein